ncbi:15095_t:CDS:2, partial [Gigaspora margarita]
KVKIELPVLAVEINFARYMEQLLSTTAKRKHGTELIRIQPLAGILIIERKFMSHLQSDEVGKDNNRQDWSFGLKFAIYTMNNSIFRAHNKKHYELVFDGVSHGHSSALDHLFEVRLENIQESVDDLDDLIDNTIPIAATESSSEMGPLGVKELPELENIPTDYISVRKAARNQNTGTLTGTMHKCKGSCNTNKCRLQKSWRLMWEQM